MKLIAPDTALMEPATRPPQEELNQISRMAFLKQLTTFLLASLLGGKYTLGAENETKGKEKISSSLNGILPDRMLFVPTSSNESLEQKSAAALAACHQVDYVRELCKAIAGELPPNQTFIISVWDPDPKSPDRRVNRIAPEFDIQKDAAAWNDADLTLALSKDVVEKFGRDKHGKSQPIPGVLYNGKDLQVSAGYPPTYHLSFVTNEMFERFVATKLRDKSKMNNCPLEDHKGFQVGTMQIGASFFYQWASKQKLHWKKGLTPESFIEELRKAWRENPEDHWKEFVTTFNNPRKQALTVYENLEPHVPEETGIAMADTYADFLRQETALILGTKKPDDIPLKFTLQKVPPYTYQMFKVSLK